MEYLNRKRNSNSQNSLFDDLCRKPSGQKHINQSSLSNNNIYFNPNNQKNYNNNIKNLTHIYDSGSNKKLSNNQSITSNSLSTVVYKSEHDYSNSNNFSNFHSNFFHFNQKSKDDMSLQSYFKNNNNEEKNDDTKPSNIPNTHKQFNFHIGRQKSQLNQKELPICSYKGQILNSIFENQVTIISGRTGCGKTTQVPKLILQCFNKSKILMTQPRRLAVITIHDR